jgi:hypothetical protein
MAWHFDDSVFRTVMDGKNARQLTTIFACDWCWELYGLSQKVKRIWKQIIFHWNQSVWERESEREWESAMADESRLGRYRRTVVGYVAGQLGGEKSWTFFFQTLVIIFSSAVGRKPCLPPPPLREKKGGVMESKENSFFFCFRFGIFSFHNVSGSIPGALYTIRNTTGDWQVNDFHTPFGMLIIMPCPIIDAILRIMDHRMDFINFLFFSKRLILGAKKFWKRISLLICFLFFFPISPKGKEGGRISITSKKRPDRCAHVIAKETDPCGVSARIYF